METELYKVVSSETIRVSRFEITEDKFENKERSYSFIRIKPGICVIIETPNGFVVLNEYRYPIKKWSYEFVAGIIDDGETPAEAAVREAKEETGFVADSIESLGEFYPSFGATDEVIHLFYARCSRHESAEHEDTELITYEIMSKDEIEDLIRTGKFKHGAGLAAWLKYLLRYK